MTNSVINSYPGTTIKTIETHDVIIVFALISQQGFPILSTSTLADFLLIIFSFYVTFIAIKHSLFVVEEKFFWFFLLFLILHLIHGISFGSFSAPMTIGFLLRIYSAYLSIIILRQKFITLYIRIVYYFALLSLIFYLCIVVLPNFENLLFLAYDKVFRDFAIFGENAARYHVLVYVFDWWIITNPPRNAGPFWEPGGFGVYLNIALMFNLIIEKRLFNQINCILLIAIITTLSTGTYLSTFTLLAFFFLSGKSIKYTFFAAPIIVVLWGYVYVNIPFMQEKIVSQIEFYQDRGTSPVGGRFSRFQGTAFDLEIFASNPIFGRGNFIRTDFERDVNSFTTIFKQFGLIGAFSIGFLLLKSFRNICKIYKFNLRFSFYMLLILIVIVFSQSMFRKPIFFVLCFLYLIPNTPKKMKNLINR